MVIYRGILTLEIRRLKLPWYLTAVMFYNIGPVSPTIIRLGWKGLPGTNTLAYY